MRTLRLVCTMCRQPQDVNLRTQARGVRGSKEMSGRAVERNASTPRRWWICLSSRCSQVRVCAFPNLNTVCRLSGVQVSTHTRGLTRLNLFSFFTKGGRSSARCL